MHGIVSVESAMLLEEEDVEISVTKETPKEHSKMDTDESSADAPGANVSTQDAIGAANARAGNGVPESAKATEMETDAKVEGSKKKVKKMTVPIAETVFGALLSADLQKAIEKEFEMALQDRVMEETKDKKNAVESYVYDMRNKMNDKYHDFVTNLERDQFTTKLQAVEDWLYDEGEDETKGVYLAKLEELKRHGDPIEELYKEHINRGSVVSEFVNCMNTFREEAISNDPKYEHIDVSEKQKVLNECVEAEAWLHEKQQQQDALPKYATPVLLSADIRRKAEVIDRFCKSIMRKPKPAKPTTPEMPAQSPGSGNQPRGDSGSDPSANTGADHGGGFGEQPPPSGEPMDTDKPEIPPSL